MKKIYIAHPLRGDGHDTKRIHANEERIRDIMRRLAAEEPNLLLFSPIHAFGYLDPMGPQEWVMKQCLEMVEVCDELWVYGDWQGSIGCRMEIERARALGKPVVFKDKGHIYLALDKETVRCIEEISSCEVCSFSKAASMLIRLGFTTLTKEGYFHEEH